MRIGVFTSGGDAPGMNACVRAVVRAGAVAGAEVVGIKRGYAGLLAGELEPMGPRSVSNIVQRGGTILRTSRSDEFMTEAGQKKAAEILRQHGVDALVAIGGDGTFRGCVDLARFWDGRIIGAPGTIDNDLWGTDYTIGFDTAVTTAVEAIDKIRDTAEATERLFLIEVMGRHAGFIALEAAVASGAEEALCPETATDVGALAERIKAARARGKLSSLVVVAEGDPCGGAMALQKELAKRLSFESRVVILGHLQRGGSPTVRDRILASRLGAFAVQALLAGETLKMVGEVRGELVLTPLEDTWAKKKELPRGVTELMRVLAT